MLGHWSVMLVSVGSLIRNVGLRWVSDLASRSPIRYVGLWSVADKTCWSSIGPNGSPKGLQWVTNRFPIVIIFLWTLWKQDCIQAGKLQKLLDSPIIYSYCLQKKFEINKKLYLHILLSFNVHFNILSHYLFICKWIF